jgi:hypothetical protein
MPFTVHPTCFNEEGHCLHWVQETIDDMAILCHGGEIPNFTPHISQSSGSACGNPWNVLSDNYASRIRNTEPEAQTPPTHGKRPIMVSQLLSRSELLKHLEKTIDADCWSVYSRDVMHHVVRKLYYQLPLDDPEERVVEDAKRSALSYEELCSSLDDPTHELCLSLGSSPFLDIYLLKLREDLYLEVSVGL